MESSASDTIELTTPPSRPPALEPNAYFTTLLGLFIAFSTFLVGRTALQSLGEWIGLSQYAAWAFSSSADKIIYTAMLLGIVIFVERRPIRSVGLVPLTRLDFGLGLALFAAVVVVSAGYNALLYKMFPGFNTDVAAGQFARMSSIPIAFFLFEVFVNGFFEEIAARGYAIERLQAATGSIVLASVIALALDLAIHVPFWGWKYPILIFPSQTLFVLMYLWRRNISACIVAHIAVDGMYAIISAGGIAAIMSVIGGGNSHSMLASRAFARNDYKGAIAEFSKALQKNPADMKLLLFRAVAENQDRDFGAALEDLDEVIRRDPANLDAYQMRESAYYETGLYDQALSNANKVVSLAPKNSYSYISRAYVFEEQKQFDKAAADFSDAIKYSRTQDGDEYQRRGLVYLSMRDYDRAIADLTQAAKLDSNHSGIFDFRASAYLAKKQDDSAIADLTRALRIDPKDTSAYLQRAAAYQDRRQYDLAFADLTRAVEVSPDNSEAQNALAWMMSTSPDQKFRNGKDALTHASKACYLSSWQQGNLIDTLAAAYAELGNFSEAVMWEQRAITLPDMMSASSAMQQDAAKRLELYKAKQPYRDTSPLG
jgi:tetratricopeptide (TPR) repeat protein